MKSAQQRRQTALKASIMSKFNKCWNVVYNLKYRQASRHWRHKMQWTPA